MSKKIKALKVSEETGVAIEDLSRLPTDALDLLDALVPDPILIDEDLIGGKPTKEIVGYHMITGEPIWK